MCEGIPGHEERGPKRPAPHFRCPTSIRPAVAGIVLLCGTSLPLAAVHEEGDFPPGQLITCPASPEPPTARAKAATDALSRFQFEPFVFVADELSSARLLVAPVRPDVNRISLPLEDLAGPARQPAYFGYGDLELVDDGTGADEVAGDGVFTGLVTLVTPSFQTRPDSVSPVSHHEQRVRSIDLTLHLADGSSIEVTEDVATFTAHIQTRPSVTPVELAPGVFATPDVINVVDRSLVDPYPNTTVDQREAANRIYAVLPDSFDWLVFFNIYNQRLAIAGTMGRLRNAIEGIGVPLFDNGAGWGSPSALRGAIRTFGGNFGATTHEIGHTWGVAGFDALGLVGSHWGTLVTGDRAPVLSPPSTYRSFTDLGGGLFEGCVGGPDKPIALELYLMGLVPSSEIGSYSFLMDPVRIGPASNCLPRAGDVYQSTGLDTLDEAKILAAFGPRSPAYPDVSHFNAAAVVVSERPLNEAELGFVSLGFQYQTQQFSAALAGKASLCYELAAPESAPATLTVSKSGDGQGTVFSLPRAGFGAGIFCGEDCSEVFHCANVVSLLANPEPGSRFAGWGGAEDCLDGMITASSDVSCIARFDSVPTHLLQRSSFGNHKTSDLHCGLCSSPTEIRAEDVVLTATSTISEIILWGGYVTDQPIPDRMALEIYDDDGGIPTGAPLYSRVDLVPARRPTGALLLFSGASPPALLNAYELRMLLDDPPELGPGTYWIALANDSSGASAAIDFVWHAGAVDTASGRNGHAVFTEGGGWATDAGNLSILVPAVSGQIFADGFESIAASARTGG